MTTDVLMLIGDKALSWVTDNLMQFRIDDSNDDLMLARQIKPISELALTCDVIRNAEYKSPMFPDLQQVSSTILQHCWNQLGAGEHVRRLLLSYPDLYSLTTVYPPFFRAGLRSISLEKAIKIATSDPNVGAMEFPPWRLIDFATTLETCGFDSPWKSSEILTQTWLGHTPAPWSLSDSSAYSLTHVVFYLTRFGAEPEGLSETYRSYLRRWLPVWFRYYIRNENLDLLCEMLMVAAHISVDVESTFAIEHISSRQHATGFVPGPLPDDVISSGSTPTEYDLFLAHYHTTLVAIMACVARFRATRSRQSIHKA